MSVCAVGVSSVRCTWNLQDLQIENSISVKGGIAYIISGVRSVQCPLVILKCCLMLYQSLRLESITQDDQY